MTEFRRLLDSSSTPATRELLRSGLSDQPRRDVRERAALALGLSAGIAATSAVASATAASAAAGATVGAAGAGSAAGKSLGALALVKWLSIGVTAGVVAAGGAAVVRHEVARHATTARGPDAGGAPRGAQDTPSAVKSPRNGAGAEPNAAAAQSNGAFTAPLGAPSALAPTPPAGTARAAVSHPAPPRPPQTQTPIPTPASGALAREVAQIDAARSALAAGDTARALAELERYERTRETPTFVREAELLRIDAFATRGERARAAELARRYLARFPNDAHAVKLREEFAQ